MMLNKCTNALTANGLGGSTALHSAKSFRLPTKHSCTECVSRDTYWSEICFESTRDEQTISALGSFAYVINSKVRL